MRDLLIALLLALGLDSAVPGADRPGAGGHERPAAVTQMEQTGAAEQTAQQARQKLDALVAELSTTLTAQERESFLLVHTQWDHFCKEDCTWKRRFFEQGSVAPQVYWNCVNEHVLQRIGDLKILLCEGRGMTGPCEASEKY